MNWEALGAIGEVGGAIAVVATLVYLAREVRESAQSTRIAAFHQAQEQLWSISAAISTDRELTALIARKFSGGIDDLAAIEERVRLEFALSGFYFGVESLLTLHEQGLIEPELWDNLIENNYRLFASPLGRELLAIRHGSISRRLEAAIEAHGAKRRVPESDA